MKPVKLKPWDQLSREEQDLYLTILWNDDYSEKAIAEFLKATKGQIVRRRHSGLKLATGKRGKVKSSVESDRFFDLLDIEHMDVMVENGATPLCPVEHEEERVSKPLRQTPELSIVPNEQTATCEWPINTGRSLKTSALCGKSAAPGSKLCEQHKRIARGLPPNKL